jgi:hypothetical protein
MDMIAVHSATCNLQPFRTRKETLRFSDNYINSERLPSRRSARTRPAVFACSTVSAIDQLTPARALLRLARRYGPSA